MPKRADLSFEETLAALDSLAGQRVYVTVRPLNRPLVEVVRIDGILRRDETSIMAFDGSVVFALADERDGTPHGLLQLHPGVFDSASAVRGRSVTIYMGDMQDDDDDVLVIEVQTFVATLAAFSVGRRA